ncbi:hypothetical protein G7Y89_g11743 [Cudoniella acicularis]|uniref:Uncharacterized protein n=1 Tax=Cudoniella acicularis TaxID=354080 RepID=A0A8H4VY10_9HELO|nr:hypothetical protein G7Y89_g11743 [Cudoniella acicularis]
MCIKYLILTRCHHKRVESHITRCQLYDFFGPDWCKNLPGGILKRYVNHEQAEERCSMCRSRKNWGKKVPSFDEDESARDEDSDEDEDGGGDDDDDEDEDAEGDSGGDGNGEGDGEND